ncbi:hypothetical protein RCO28_16730 [Streptomyces sp. LHD-70]|uniref:hypothetical protein n=1 Tax=Streptomyces sp. LHD-70 TaxID=3072140 RepID=UPI00280EE0C0|nr:hypothetical protein [Streptomyces sp. LHD-70]MDQ8704120.1 hypothetical protein [Streptomyces sp. LHD-70]
MTDTSSTDAWALRATASSFNAVRGKLPATGDPDRPLDSVTVARQLSAVGILLADLTDEVLFRDAEQRRDGYTSPAVTGFAAAIRPACEAASALGTVAHRLSARDQALHLGDEPEAEENDRLVMGNALGIADEALRETCEGLRAAAAAISPSPARVEAARSRSVTAAPSPAPPPPAIPPAAPPIRITRGR